MVPGFASQSLEIGYVHIHEDDVNKAHVKGRAHHHYHFISEGCEVLKNHLRDLAEMDVHIFGEPSSKSLRRDNAVYY